MMKMTTKTMAEVNPDHIRCRSSVSASIDSGPSYRAMPWSAIVAHPEECVALFLWQGARVGQGVRQPGSSIGTRRRSGNEGCQGGGIKHVLQPQHPRRKA